jgi:hypothetical protein
MNLLQCFVSEDPNLIIVSYEAAIMRCRRVKQQGEESHEAFEKLTLDKNALDNELFVLLTSVTQCSLKTASSS